IENERQIKMVIRIAPFPAAIGQAVAPLPNDHSALRIPNPFTGWLAEIEGSFNQLLAVAIPEFKSAIAQSAAVILLRKQGAVRSPAPAWAMLLASGKGDEAQFLSGRVVLDEFAILLPVAVVFAAQQMVHGVVDAPRAMANRFAAPDPANRRDFSAK